MSDTAEKWVEAFAEKYRDESELFDGDESLAEVTQVALEQALNIRDQDGTPLSKNQREITAEQERLREQLGLSGPSKISDSGTAEGSPVEREQARLRDQIIGR